MGAVAAVLPPAGVALTVAPLLTAAVVRRLLAAHGLAPRRRDGQNFVVDPGVVRAIVRDAGVRPGELVLEVGPGLGSLTLGLREAGARVVAVELDAGLVRALGEVVGDDPDVRVVHGDALRLDAELLLGGPAALVANLPYHAATPILLTLLPWEGLARAHVMVQREVGQRWAAAPGDPRFGAVSVKVAAYGTARTIRRVSRESFYPVPHVDSVTVEVIPRPWPYAIDRGEVLALVDAGFAQRRKQLVNALTAAGWDRRAVLAGLADAGIDASVRAERLGLDDWVRLAHGLVGGGSPP